MWLEVLEKLRAMFANFLTTFLNTLDSKNVIRDLNKLYAEGDGKMSQPQKMLTSSFKLQNGTLITLLLLFYLQLGLVVTKNTLCGVHSEEMFQQLCTINSERKKKKERKSNLPCSRRNDEASGQKLFWLPHYGLQATHCNDEAQQPKTHETINSKLFKNLDHVNNSLFEVELNKAVIEYKKAYPCRVLYSSIRKNLDVVALLQPFRQLRWREQVQRVEKGNKFAVSWSCPQGTGKQHPTWNENRVGTIAVERLQLLFRCWCVRKFPVPNALWQAEKKFKERAWTLKIGVYLFRDVFI